MTKLIDIEGIGPVFAQKLEDAGVSSVEDLLAKGANPAGRKKIEDATGITGTLILRWVNHADLFRINGVSEEYADLLEAAGVDTVVELSKRVPANLLAKMSEVNGKTNKVRRLPSQGQVDSWVEHAKTLPRAVSY